MSIEKRIARLEGLSDSDSIRTFESFMAECCKLTNALESGVKLDTLKFRKFHPVMNAGLAKAIPDIEQAMRDALETQETLPLELTAQLILIYLDAGTRALLSPTLLELIEHILALERDGALSVAAE
jgi:hypothetical protein